MPPTGEPNHFRAFVPAAKIPPYVGLYVLLRNQDKQGNGTSIPDFSKNTPLSPCPSRTPTSGDGANYNVLTVLGQYLGRSHVSLKSLIAAGTKIWLDSIDPDLVRKNRAHSARPPARPATRSIISDLIKTGRFDNDMQAFIDQGDGRHRHRLGADRQAGEGRPGRLRARVGRDARKQRLRLLRTRPAAGGCRRANPARRRSREVRGTRQKVGDGTQEPHDQGPGHARRPRRPRAPRPRRHHSQCDADFLRAAIRNRTQQRLARRRSGQAG